MENVGAVCPAKQRHLHTNTHAGTHTLTQHKGNALKSGVAAPAKQKLKPKKQRRHTHTHTSIQNFDLLYARMLCHSLAHSLSLSLSLSSFCHCRPDIIAINLFCIAFAVQQRQRDCEIAQRKLLQKKIYSYQGKGKWAGGNNNKQKGHKIKKERNE